ncbi:hypothetical protein AM593_01904, partial [Mytilus galloprovincialis]
MYSSVYYEFNYLYLDIISFIVLLFFRQLPPEVTIIVNRPIPVVIAIVIATHNRMP